MQYTINYTLLLLLLCFPNLQAENVKNNSLGHDYIKNKCTYCHITPSLTASIYTKKQWIQQFKTKDFNLIKPNNDKLYIAHSFDTVILENLNFVIHNKPSKRFLYYHARKTKIN